MTMSRNSPGLLLAPVILVVILASTVACSSSSPDDAPGNNGGPGTSPSHCLTAPDPVVLRNELVAGQPTASPRLLLRFAQMTDDHIMDEDGAAVNGGSPLDPLHPVFEAAQRFQDEYTDEVLNAMVKTINGCHAAAPVAFVVATGDNTDLGTVAEVRRFIDNLDGDFDR
ncbi:MAG: hypothetical protein ACRESW_11045, partial [Nevskiales bacterium]